MYKFGDIVHTPDGQATVQEDQVVNSDEVKVQLQGEDVFKVYKIADLTTEDE